jgi:peptidylprolyl isomerase
MKQFLITLTLIASALVVGSCSAGGANTGSNSNGQITTGVIPVADDEVAVIEMEKPDVYGTIKIELYSNVAPLAVARFKTLAREGVYDGMTFHRVNQSVIQSGDPNSKDNDPRNDGMGSTDKPNVPAEFSDIPYDVGIVGAARKGNDINSANSQFFITLRRTADFDKKYTVFGRVIEGMNHARTIAGVTPKEGERPVEDVRIKTVRIVPKS